MLNRSHDSCSRYFGQCGSTVLERQAIRHNFTEIVSIERFWRWAREEGRRQKSRDVRCGGASGTSECTPDVGCGTSVLPYPIVDQRITGSGVESEDFGSFPNPSDIGNSTDVEDGERPRQRRGDSGMEQRSEWRSFTACRDIGRAKIGNDVEPEKLRQQGSVTQLPGAALGRAMQDGVTMQADDVDTRIRMARGKLLDCVGVKPCQLSFDLRSRTSAAENRA